MSVKPLTCHWYACLVLLAVLVITCDSSRHIDHELDAGFNDYVQEALDDWGAPGIMIVVVKGDQTVYMKGHGSRVLGADRPIDETTIIQIASHTKPVTATAVAMLVDEGRLSWDDPVKMHIPEFELPDPYAAEHATIRDVLSHQVGLPSAPGGFTDPDFDFSALVTALSTRPLVGDFRDGCNYSNAGYAVVGEVVSRVSGMSWEQFIKKRVFDPLGMWSSYTSTPDMITHLGPPTVDKNIFMPVEENGDSVVLGNWINASCGVLYAPAGGILTTGNDISKWMVFQLQNGTFGGERLVSEESLWETRKPEVVYDLWFHSENNPLAHTAAYGLGWVSFEYQGRVVYEHPGGWMSSNIAFVPEENLAVGTFTNANFNSGLRSIGLVSALKMEILERLLGAPDEDWSELFLNERN
ncbi:serine hydrolase domain-containing protein [Gemmatimonadota bacterium]